MNEKINWLDMRFWMYLMPYVIPNDGGVKQVDYVQLLLSQLFVRMGELTSHIGQDEREVSKVRNTGKD